MANPNPQASPFKFKGARDIKAKTGASSPMHLESGELLKFGKRVAFEGKLTNQEILDDHLRQIREINEKKRLQKDIKMKDDQQFLQYVSNQIKMEKEKHFRLNEDLKKSFLDFNDVKKVDNRVNK